MLNDDLITKATEQVESDGHRLLLVTVYGSHLYGTNTSKSDRDYYGMYLPSDKSVLLGERVKSYRVQTGEEGKKNTPDDVDVTIVDIRKVLRNYTQGEINAMDLLFAYKNPAAVLHMDPLFEVVTSALESQELRICDYKGVLGYVWGQVNKYGMKGTKLAEALELLHHLQHFGFVGADLDLSWVINNTRVPTGRFVKLVDVVVTTKNGYEYRTGLSVLGKTLMPYESVDAAIKKVEKWISAYGGRAEEARKNRGVDWKAVSHAYRALVQAELYHELGYVPLPLPDNERELIIALKQGDYDFSEAERLITDKLNTVASYNYTCNPRAVDNVILRLYGRQE